MPMTDRTNLSQHTEERKSMKHTIVSFNSLEEMAEALRAGTILPTHATRRFPGSRWRVLTTSTRQPDVLSVLLRSQREVANMEFSPLTRIQFDMALSLAKAMDHKWSEVNYPFSRQWNHPN